jgi:hypothetical protein
VIMLRALLFWACRFVSDGDWESQPPPPPLLNEALVRGFDFDEALPPAEDTRSEAQVEADRRKAKAAMKADRTQQTAQAAVELYTWKEQVGSMARIPGNPIVTRIASTSLEKQAGQSPS